MQYPAGVAGSGEAIVLWRKWLLGAVLLVVGGGEIHAQTTAPALPLTHAQAAEKAAFEAIEKKAADGDVRAMRELGRCYVRGRYTRVDRAKAQGWFEKAVAKGDGVSAALLGDMLRQPAPAAILFNADVIDAGFVYPPEVYKKSLEWYQKSADMGCSRGIISLGQCYDRGEGVEKDFATARRLYMKGVEAARREAADNDPEGMFTLGWIYRDGKALGGDYYEAIKWLRKAADMGHGEAMLLLASRYANGQGADRDYDAALKWYKKASKEGISGAMVQLGVMYGNGQGVKYDPHIAVNYFARAAEHEDADGYFQLGFMYLNGDVQHDPPRAIKLLEKADEMGAVSATYLLGRAYYSGDVVSRDRTKARKYIEKSAAGGDLEARQWLREHPVESDDK
jgi:TPR repeat protein